MKDKVIQVGGYIKAKNRDNPNNGRVYSIDGISPCLNSAMGMGGNLVPVIVKKYESMKTDNKYGLWFKGKFISEGDGLYLGTSDDFFRGGLDGISRCLKANGQDAGTCVRFENLKTDNMRDFHKYCRVVYRAMRRLYGKERVQDECLRVFKVVFPLLHKARMTGECAFDEKSIKRVREIFDSWNVETFSELDILLCGIVDRMEKPFIKDEFVIFCEDILVVVMRIRKLTPRECGRLMDVSEKDIDTMLSCGISKSALYRLYGNSIVEACLFHIFRTLFIKRDKPKAGDQLLLF